MERVSLAIEPELLARFDSLILRAGVHLDHEHCLEVISLRGHPKHLRTVADRLISMKGVKHGKLVISSAEP